MKIVFITLVLTLLQTNRLAANFSESADDQSGSISGIVTNSKTGEPVADAIVRLIEVPGSYGAKASRRELTTIEATTDVKGEFRFSSLAEGSFGLIVHRTGFVPGVYGAKDSLSVGSAIKLEVAQRIDNLAIHLIPEGSIIGKVTDALGHAVSGVSVQMFRRDVLARATPALMLIDTVEVSSDGSFQFANVDVGTYFIAALPPPHPPLTKQMHDQTESSESTDNLDKQFVRTFFPASLDADGGEGIQVRAGEETKAAFIKLLRSRVFHIRGHVERVGEKIVRDTRISFFRKTQAALNDPPQFVSVDRSGKFDVPDLPPGEYRLWVSQTGDNGHFLGETEADVRSADVNSIVIRPYVPIQVKGQIFAGAKSDVDLSTARVSLESEDEHISSPDSRAAADSEGHFTVNNVVPGRYTVRLSELPHGYYAKAFELDKQSSGTPEITVSPGGAAQLSVVLVPTAARVRITPSDASEELKTSGLWIILVRVDPNYPTSMADFQLLPYRLSPVTFENLPPGHYYACAVDAAAVLGHLGVWTSAVFQQQIRSSVSQIDLVESDSKNVSVPFVSQSKIATILTDLGLSTE